LHDLRQRIVYVLESAAIVILFGFLRLLPIDWASGIGGFLGRNLGFCSHLNRIGRDNLRAAFPDKSEAEIAAILRHAWDNLCRTLAEYSQLDRLWDHRPQRIEGSGKAHYRHSRIDFADRERFLALLSSGKPCILFTGHCGNWEVLPVAAAHYGLPLAVIFRPPNREYARQLVEKVRGRSKARLLASNTLGTAAIAAASLGRGESLGLMIDQYFGHGIDLPFFGRPARTAPTLAKLAQHADCPIVGVVVERLRGARFRLHILPEVNVPRTGAGAIDATALMTAVTASLEGWVRAHPEQWLWFHRRWR
jgi:Kdo2-lipid IVA lauroyltransferase/acyltransferase